MSQWGKQPHRETDTQTDYSENITPPRFRGGVTTGHLMTKINFTFYIHVFAVQRTIYFIVINIIQVHYDPSLSFCFMSYRLITKIINVSIECPLKQHVFQSDIESATAIEIWSTAATKRNR